MRQRECGYQLLEVVVGMAIVMITAGLLLPPLLRLADGRRVRLAAGELTGVLRQARSNAIRHNCRVGVKFLVEGEDVSWTLYRDGDGDGVRNRDIDSGVDPPLGLPRTLTHLGRHIRFGFPPGPPPRDPGDPRRRLRRLDDPIRFNRSDIASFGPLGGSTPGSLYITDSIRHLSVVRVFGRTGKLKVLRWDASEDRWQ
ncbi:MAG: Tfp pilus assembly protein FimT/FimU [Thermoanaerobaculia bacterium]